MLLGVEKCRITPTIGVELAGVGRAGRRSVGVYDELYMTTLVLKHESKKAAIICADLIGFDRQLVADLKRDIKMRYGLNDDEVLFNASHTHSGPQTLRNMSEFLGKTDDKYVSFLYDAVISSIQKALENMEEVKVYLGKDKCGIGINRRLVKDGIYDFAPNEDGIRNDDVTVLKFIGREGIKAILFNYACHPTTLDTDNVSADYPGVAGNIIEKEYDTAAAFMQGCCGDIRVRTIEGKEFSGGTLDDVNAFGRELADSVIRACKNDMAEIDPYIESSKTDMELNLKEIPTREEFEYIKDNDAMYKKVWAEWMLKNYDSLRNSVQFTIQKISIGNVIIIGMEGEVCTEYSLKLKEMCSGRYTIAAGYCNGVVGYIPTRSMFSEGGYEPADSVACYSLPSQFEVDLEEKLLGTLIRITK